MKARAYLCDQWLPSIDTDVERFGPRATVELPDGLVNAWRAAYQQLATAANAIAEHLGWPDRWDGEEPEAQKRGICGTTWPDLGWPDPFDVHLCSQPTGHSGEEPHLCHCGATHD